MKLDATHLPQQQQQHPQSHQSSPQQQHQQTQQSQQSKQGPSAALSSQQPQKQQKQKQQQSKEAQQPQPSQQQQQQQQQQQSKQAQQPQPSQQQQEQLQHQQQSQQAQQPQPSQQQPPHIQLQSQQSLATSIENEKELLHGYIYDYLIKQKLFDSAKVFHKEAEVAVQSTSTAIIAGASTTSDTQTGNNSNPSGPNGSVGPDSGISSVVSIGSVSPNNSKASVNNASSGNGDTSSSSNSGAKKLSQSNDDNSKENLSSNDPSTTSDQKVHVNGVGSSSNSSTPRLNSAQDKKNANAPNTRDNINADIPKDLPLSSVQVDTPQGFLLEWWSIFWDLYNAKGMKSGSTNAQQFLQNSLRLRQEQTRMLQLQQQQQQQQTHHLQQQQQSHQLPHQMHQPGQQQQSQFPQQVTVQQLQQQPGMISQANGGMNIVAPNGQIVNYPGFINAQQANLINAGLMHNTAAASQIPDNMSDADKRNLAARQAFFRRNMSTGGLPVNQAQFQQQLFQQQQQQRMQQAQQQAQQQQQQQKQAKQPLQQPQPPHQQLQQQGQSQQPLQQPQSQQGPNQTPQQKPQPSGPPGQPAISRQPVQPGQTQPAGPGQPVPASPQIQQQAQQTPQTQPVQHQLPQQQQQQPHQLPQQGQPIRVQQNPNHQNVRPAGQVSQHQTPQPTPQFAHAQPHASNQASPASHPQEFVSQSQAVSHRNSPAIEGENLNSPSTQGGSPVKRQRLSPEGTYAAAGAAMNGQMMQNMAGQPVMISNGMQFSPQFNGGMVQMKVGMNGMPQQFPVGMMTPQQRQNLINMGKIPGQPMMGPGVVQMPGGAVTVDAQGMIVDEYGRVTGNRVPQNMAALQDYQNQLMLLERVNQQRLNDGSNGIVQPGMMNPQQALAAGGINPNQQALAAGGINPNQQVQFQKQTRSGSVASPGVPNADIPRKGQPQTPTQGPMRTSPAGNGFNGNLVQGPNGMMMAPPMQGGAHGIWTGQPNQAQSPHIQQRQSPSQGMNGPQLPPGHSPAMAHQSMNGGMGQPPNQMPPPNGPIPVIGNKTQPSSPSPANNPPTPKTAAKQIGKGNKKTDSPKRRNKKAPATPVGVSEPPTPTPTTPATPHTANASLPPTTTSAPNPASVMASAHTPNSSGSKASGNEKEKVDIEMNDAGPFNAGNPAMQINAQPMMMATGPEGMDTQMMVANNGPVLDGSVFLEDFAGNENDMDFDINTFLNEDGTSGSLGFEGSTGFWPE